MKERSFDYIKKNGEKGHYDIFVIEERDDRIFGLSKKSMTEEEKKHFKELEGVSDKFVEKAPVGSIRCFIKKNILN